MKILKRALKELVIFYFDIVGMIVFLLRFPSKDKKKRILVFRPDHFGDVLLTTSALHELKKRSPDAQIDVIAKSYSVSAIKNNPHISSIIAINFPWCCHEFQKKDSIFTILKYIISLRRKHYDEIYIFQQDWRNNVTAGLIGGQTIKGYGDSGCFSYLTHSYENLKYEYHEVDKVMNLLDVHYPTPEEHRLYYFPLSETKRSIDTFIEENSLSRFVIIHPGAGYYKRCWHTDGFIFLCQELFRKNIKVVLSYTENESSAAELIIKNTHCIDFKNRTIDELAALMEKAVCFIGHDSGPMHLATAVDCPVAAIFGPSDPKRWGPFSKQNIVIKSDICCMPCSSKPSCDHVKCLNELDPEYVSNEICAFIEGVF